MTACAIVPEPALMSLFLVVLLMARNAGERRAFEVLCLVARIAGDVRVAVSQRKPGLAVIETGLLPVDLAVAVCAPPAELARVLVVLLVAGVAIGGRFPVFLGRHVAGAALDFGRGVASFQHEVGHPVVESSCIDRRNLRIAPLVLRVAGAALFLGDAPVVPLALGDVARDVLVAVQTLPALRRAVEPHVAVFALAFELGVSLYDLAGHDRRLKTLRGRARNERGQEPSGNDPSSWHDSPQYMCT